MLQFYLPNKPVKFGVIGAEPRARQKKPEILPYLLRATALDESLLYAHLSVFLYSSITFAFLLGIVSFRTLVHETNWNIFFKTIFFKKNKKKKKQDKSKPQRRTGPTRAPGCKQQRTCGKAEADTEAADKADFGLSFGKREVGKG